MAVTNPQTPNLAPFYENIVGTINRQAEQARRPRPMSTFGAVATTAADTASTILNREREKKEQEDLLRFKFKLEDKVRENEVDRKMLAEGRTQTTQADLDALATKAGVAPEIARDIAAPLLNKYMTPEERMKYVNDAYKEVFNEDLFQEMVKTDPKKAKALRAAGPEGAKIMLSADIKGENKRQSSLLDERRRKDKLYELYRQDVKDIQFLKYQDANKAAERAATIEKPTGPSDAKLLYAYAKMLQPTGVLSDQDFRTAVNNGSYGDEAVRLLKKPAEGNVLSDSFRAKIVAEIKNRYDVADQQLSGLEDYYKGRALDEDLDPSFVRDFRVSGKATNKPIPEFDSEEEAQKANPPKGTQIKIKGRLVVVE